MKTPETINGKTPEEIKCGMECIRTNAERACVKPEKGQCPRCEQIVQDHINLVHYLESRLAQAERGRDAAVECIKNIDQILHKHVSTTVETANKVRLIQKVIADYVLSARRAVCAQSKKEGEIK